MSISYTQSLFEKNGGAFLIRKVLFSPSRRAMQSRFEKRGSDLCFCVCIQEREVLVEVHQTCWLQRLLFPVKVPFIQLVIPNARLWLTVVHL